MEGKLRLKAKPQKPKIFPFSKPSPFSSITDGNGSANTQNSPPTPTLLELIRPGAKLNGNYTAPSKIPNLIFT